MWVRPWEEAGKTNDKRKVAVTKDVLIPFVGQIICHSSTYSCQNQKIGRPWRFSSLRVPQSPRPPQPGKRKQVSMAAVVQHINKINKSLRLLRDRRYF